MRHYTLLLFTGLVLLAVSCKKDTDPKPATSSEPSTTVDDIVGTYKGSQLISKRDYVYSPNGGQTYIRDTSYTISDDVTIIKLGPDSFSLSDHDFDVYSTPLHFTYDTLNVYRMWATNLGYNQKDSVTIRFYPDSDSLSVTRYSSMNAPSQYYIYTFSFTGKK